MSSPPQSSKRKRNADSAADSISNSALQPSSRDASSEEGDTAGPEPSRRQLRSSAGNGPNPKRLRSNSGRSADVSAENVADPGEPSDTTEASVDIEARVGRRGRRSSLNGGNETMAPPPIGELIHPAGGFKTNSPPVGRAVRVYADGVFDLFHLGHMRQLEQAKKAFPDTTLVVGVTSDEDTHKRKGLTVMSAKERAESVRHCKWVDEVIEDCPWIVTPEFLQANQLDYVAHDDLPYGADEGDDIYQPVKAAGMFLVTQRTEGVSTTGIITRIVRDYEKYITRQFKRGTSRQELNVSWLKKNELDIKRHVQDLRDNIITNWTSTGQELSRELKQFWPTSRPHSPARFTSSHAEGVRSPTTPASNSGNSKEFVTGYALGLVGGVRSWMTKNRRTVASRPGSDDESEESDEHAKSPVSTTAPSLSKATGSHA
ncbi:phosphorylcholine transferase [Moelleriella libera RCEF 2490]|uniref:choline-phosphate cytidylyltransferase n=1 Tax=Moelleriella libera RCEF 2490 TaxID=1081109 RepID=A0A167YBE9_9HYPO|nr:phosphorylcholine transferase [Moelleriella libera RCEF 2490]